MCDDPDALRFHSVEYTYEELSDLAYEISLIMPESVVSVGVDEIRNSIRIGIDRTLIEQQSLLTEDEQDEFLLSVETEIREAVLSHTESSIASRFLQEEMPLDLVYVYPETVSTNITGGARIRGNGYNYSSGICGLYWKSSTEQVSVLLTAGHQLSVGTTIYDYSTSTPIQIGTVIKQQCANNAYYDYSIVEITNSSYTPTTQVLGTTITSETLSHPTGTLIRKYGVNGFATGTITGINKTVNYGSLGITIYEQVSVEITSGYVGNCGGGDSGCPIYVGSTIYGLYSSDNRVLDSSGNVTTQATSFHYTPINAIPNFDLY